jgi:hypothetical protein
MSFGGFSAGPHCHDHPGVVGGILDSSGLAAIFFGLEPPGLCYLEHFASERPGYASQKSGRPTSISRHRMGSVSGSPQDLPLILLPPGGLYTSIGAGDT